MYISKLVARHVKQNEAVVYFVTKGASPYLVSYELNPQLSVCWLLSEPPVKLFSPPGQGRVALPRLAVLPLLLRLLLLSLPLQPEGRGGVIHTERVDRPCLHSDTWIDTWHLVVNHQLRSLTYFLRLLLAPFAGCCG